MKLLFDQNLSPRLVKSLQDLFAGSAHVADVNLGEAPDRAVWEFAKNGGFAIISKDSDFSDMAALEGPPPKVITISLGNCTTNQVESLLRMRAQVIVDFGNSNDAILVLP
jgi:predicted nuclease of predicted toxin-antitoxin system